MVTGDEYGSRLQVRKGFSASPNRIAFGHGNMTHMIAGHDMNSHSLRYRKTMHATGRRPPCKGKP